MYPLCLSPQSQEERDHKKTLEDVNQVLLRNVLPNHVADHFLGANKSQVRMYMCVRIIIYCLLVCGY